MLKDIQHILICILLLGGMNLNCSQKREPVPDGQQDVSIFSDDSTTSDMRQSINDEVSYSRQNAITRAVSQVSPAVVGINVTSIKRYVQRSPFEDDPFWGWFFKPREYQEKVQGLGSGFLISHNGYVLTNEHVLQNAQKIVVTTTDGKQYEAKVVGQDATYDISLLKIEGDNFPYIPLGDSDHILIAEWVIALGNPFGLFDVSSKPTVTVGVISATNMNFKGQFGIQGRSYQNMIQTDASINGGNSGGPLVNSLGECIGINTFIISGSEYSKTSVGIGFAIPINRVKKILPDLKNIGRVNRSFRTGLEVENMSYLIARMLELSPRDGVIITRVTRGSSADEAGLEVGDVIVMIDGQRVRSTTDVQQIINSVDITEEQIMRLKIFRKKRLFDMELSLDVQ